jgi:hypothetical protein
MAQQSARRVRMNQVYSSCLEHAFMIWSPVCELPYGPRSFIAASSEAGQMAASDYVPIFFKNRLHLAGRPQMSTRPNHADCRRNSQFCAKKSPGATAGTRARSKGRSQEIIPEQG